jgi:DHA1 family quinolone resistance protein-like MFS transporter
MPNIPTERHNVPLFSPELFRKSRVVFIVFLIRHIGANIVWIVYPLFLAQLGAGLVEMSLLYAANPFVQSLFMFSITDRLLSRRLIVLGLSFSFLAFSSMYFATNIWHIVPIQLFVATSWSCLYVGALRNVTETDVRKATVTGLLNSVIQLGSSVGPLVGGTISELSGGYRGNALIAASVIFVSLLFYTGYLWKTRP